MFAGAATTAVMTLAAISQPAQALMIHRFLFSGTNQLGPEFGDKETIFTGHLAFDEFGGNVGFSLDIRAEPDDSPAFPPFNFDFEDAFLGFGAADTALGVFGTPADGSGTPGDSLLVAFQFDQRLPGFGGLSEFLAGDVSAIASPGIAVPGLSLEQTTIEGVTFDKKVPEPTSTVALLGFGLAGFGVSRRRQAA